MKAAMMAAPLGDDVLGDDPTVIRLQEMAAALLGKEAALFVPSGTQANLVSMLTHCPRGREVLVGERAHILIFEAGGAFGLGGLGLRPVRNDERGRLDLDDLERKVRGDNDHFPRTGLICVENTHNLAGGTVLDESDLRAVREVAVRHGLPIHMDGARIFNASVKLGLPPAQLARYADSVSFCLSKGLACPVGSLVCGSRAFIAEAHRNRKMLGGGMRQAGILAGAGVYALEHMIDRLAEDHDNAAAAAEGLAGMPGVNLTPPPDTNLVYFTVDGWDLGKLVEKLGELGVLCFDEGGRIRWVTHHGIERADIYEALERTRSVLAMAA
jgi:threonine aldolase